MDLSLLPTPVSEYTKQTTGARFTVRSANSPFYSLTRRPGVRKPRAFLEEERESAEEVRDREKFVTLTGTNGSKKEDNHPVTYQAKTGSRTSVKDQCEEKEASSHKMSTKLDQNGTGDKTVAEFGTDRGENLAFESRGRTEWRRYNLPARSKSLDWRTGERSPDRSKRTDMSVLSTKNGADISKQPAVLEERRTGVDGVRGRVMSSIQAYNSVGTSNIAPERSSVTLGSQTLDRASRGNSLPSRLRSQSGCGSGVRERAASLVPKGGQSIQERIEKLYESTGFGKTEDCSKIRDFSTPVMSHHKGTTTDSLISPQQRSYERSAGGTFPRRFSSGENSSLSPMQSRKSFTWTQKDASGSEASLSSETSKTRERFSEEQWQGQILGQYSEEGGVNSGRGIEEIGTRSLDRVRSRYTVAAQIRSARAAGGITSPQQSNTFSEEERSVPLRDSIGLKERRVSGSKDEGRGSHGEGKGKTNGTLGERTGGLKEQDKEADDGPKKKNERKTSSTDEDVFESNPQKIILKTIERKKYPEVHSAASVRNKINQFEALTQRAQSLATGQILMPRRSNSVPTPLSRDHVGVKKSGSAKAIGGLKDKWEELKEGGEAGYKTEEKVTGAGRKLGSERSLSVDQVGLRLRGKEREGKDLVENEGKETDIGDNRSEDFGEYSRLKSSLQIPLDAGAQRKFYIDETDFSKVSSPEAASKRAPPSLLSNSNGTTLSCVTSPISDEDKTPTNTPNHSPFLSPIQQRENTPPIADSKNESTSVLTQAAETREGDSPPLPCPLAISSHSNLTDLISPEVNAAFLPNGKRGVLDLDAWVAGSNAKTKVWDDNEDDYGDDDESTQKDEDSNYDSDSGESSVTVTSNMSQSDRRSFCVSLSDLCNFAGADFDSENDSDECQSTGRRSASLSSDISVLSCVSVLPSEELDRLLEDVRSLGDSKLQDYDDVQVVVLHKEVGVGLGFSVAGGVDQNKAVTVHKVFHSGVAAQEGSIKEGDQVLSINGTALCGYAHWEALRVLRRAKTREMGVVVLRRGGSGGVCKRGAHTNNQGPTQTQFTETGERVRVRLEKNSRDLGFSLEGGVGSSLEDRPLTVQKIFQGGPVDKVRPGDEVIEIEGVSMVGMRRLEAWTLIRRLPPGPVDVVLLRPLKRLET
ncbi:serine-rich adhesin for platelets [Pempheris klunzingeri]|uniref:serine-rich adhesin for platelets n=1 Tax=Pempheris klunzingeri TaxID=3127111 RepID=UPI00397F8779